MTNDGELTNQSCSINATSLWERVACTRDNVRKSEDSRSTYLWAKWLRNNPHLFYWWLSAAPDFTVWSAPGLASCSKGHSLIRFPNLWGLLARSWPEDFGYLGSYLLQFFRIFYLNGSTMTTNFQHWLLHYSVCGKSFQSCFVLITWRNLRNPKQYREQLCFCFNFYPI